MWRRSATASITDAATFFRNTRPNLAQYISERPEIASQGEMSKDGQKQQRKIKNEKIKYYIRHNSGGAWLLCVFAGGESRPANRRFMA
jgi:hypothetical protein